MQINTPLEFKSLNDIENIEVEILGKDYLPIHRSNYNLLAGNGGTGKSMIALKAMVNHLVEKPKEKVLGIFSEDTKAEIYNRLNNITSSMDITVKEVIDRAFFKTLDNDDGRVFTTKSKNTIVDNAEYINEFKRNLVIHKVGFVVLDPLERFHTGLEENNEGDMKHLVTDIFQRIAVDTGVAMLVLHHTSKADKSGFRGSGVIANKGRIAYNIRKNMQMNKDLGLEAVRKGWETSVVLSTIKDNHYISKYCDCIQNQGGKLDLPVKREPKIRHQDKDGRYTAAPKKQTSEKPVHISLANHNSEHNADGFIKKEVSWNGLVDLITSNMAYSPSFFKDGHRSSQNYLGGNEVVFLDIDEGLTFAEGKEMFRNLKAILITTKSHQKMKNGIIADRFRVVLHLDTPINLDKSEYKIAMQAIFDMFGSVADQSTKDPARFFFSSPTDCQVHYTKSENLFNWRDPYNTVRRLQNIESQKNQQSMNFEYKDTTLQQAADALNRLNPDCEYDIWVNCGMALQAEFGDAGYQVWDDWSRRGSKYNERQMQNKWRSFNGSGIKIGTLFHYSKASV